MNYKPNFILYLVISSVISHFAIDNFWYGFFMVGIHQVLIIIFIQYQELAIDVITNHFITPFLTTIIFNYLMVIPFKSINHGMLLGNHICCCSLSICDGLKDIYDGLID